MGVCFKSNSKTTHMCYSSFGIIRRTIAKYFDTELSDLYNIQYDEVLRKADFDTYINAIKTTQDKINEYVKVHNDVDTITLVKFLQQSDCDGALSKRECKRVLKAVDNMLNKASSDEIKVLDLGCVFKDFYDTLKEGSEFDGIKWS